VAFASKCPLPPSHVGPQAADKHDSEAQRHPNGNRIRRATLNDKQHNSGTGPCTD
jgi:hypothetical protein